jgi:hypothetical protein
MAPGDIYLTNDPWIASGHLNDFLLMMPVFHRGRVVGFTACTSHLVDLGGLGMGPEGSDIYDEGLLIPPCKLVERGTVNTLLMEIVKANSREPIANEGDIYALIACCEAGATRLVAMMEEFGLETLDPLATTSSRPRAGTRWRHRGGPERAPGQPCAWMATRRPSTSMRRADHRRGHVASGFRRQFGPARPRASTCR